MNGKMGAELKELFPKRVTILAGHFGSGKTEIALNAALTFSAEGEQVSLIDLDVVKPYFRSRSAKNFLEEGGVELVAPKGEYYSSDLPIILPEVRGRICNPKLRIFIDAGGDDSGTRAVGSLTDVLPPDETGFLLVLNFRRPFTLDVASAVAMVRKIEATARLSVTGIISNTHLMDETTVSIIREGYALAVETAKQIGTRVTAVAASEKDMDALKKEHLDCPLISIRRIVKPPFEVARNEHSVGPIFVVG